MADAANTVGGAAHAPSIGQERLWFLHKVRQGNPVLTVAELVVVEGELNVERLRAALTQLSARHESLRTAFPPTDGRPRRVVSPQPDVALTFTAHAPAPVVQERHSDIQRWAKARTRQPFDVERGPLWRTEVLSLGAKMHALLVCAHQLVADRRSLGIMLDELGRMYSAATAGVPLDLPPAQAFTVHADVAGHRLDEASFTSVLDARLEALAGIPAGIELPADRLRPPTLTFPGAHVPVRLTNAVPHDVEAFADTHGATAEVVLLTAFAALVHRYTGVTDIVVGTPSREPAEVVGPLTNLLVVRVDLSGDPTFSEALERVRRAIAEAHTHRDVPFEMIVERLQLERDLSQRPVCQLGFESRPAPTCVLAGATTTPVPFDQGSSAFDLALLVSPDPAQTGLAVEYDTDLFKVDTITRLADNLDTLLTSVVAKPSERIGRQRLLSHAEVRRLATEWNGARVDFPRDKLVHQLVVEQAERRPAATALVAGDERVTYRELNRRANQVANQLRTLAVGPGVSVGVCLPRSVDMVVAVLGVYKTGAAAVLMDPAQPTRRIGYLLDDSRAPAVLTTEALLPSLPSAFGGHILCMDRDLGLFERMEDTDPPEQAHRSAPCQIAYTSGSTGEPRGVVFAHGAVLVGSYGTRRAYTLTEDDRGTWISAPGFGISFVNELWPFLTVGAAVHIADETTVASPFRLRDWMISNHITVTMLAKVLAERVCRIDWPSKVALRILMVSGERVGWLPSSLPFEVVTIYGATETTNATTCLNEADGIRVTPKSVPPEGRHSSTSPVGRPVPNARVYILDGHLQPVPIGVTGQVLVGGDLIQSGYLNRPDDTARKWRPDPFSGPRGARMVATGDIGRWLADGTIEVLGRADDQVSLNGYRIELGEVSFRLLGHPAVRQVAVVVREDTPGERRLVAYIVADSHRRPSSSDLRDLLKEHLPAYMVPGTFVPLDALPMLPNGKVDRRALPAPDAPRSTADRYGAPSTTTEQALVDLWRHVLRQEHVGVRDNYFELGGDSLTGMELVASVGAVLRVDLPLRVLFEAPTVEEMAAAVERARADDSTDLAERSDRPPVTADPALRFDPFPLTDIQHAYWIGRTGGIELGDVGCHGYQEWDVAKLDPERLRRAVDRLVERHDMLRAVVTTDGQQRVLPRVPPYELTVTDLRVSAPDQREARLAAIREELSHRVLPADQWPLFDLRVTIVDESIARVHVSFDLLIFDARSARIFTQELAQFYRDPDLALAPLELSFRDYVTSERRWRETSPEFHASRRYWQERLDDIPPAPELPYLRTLASVREPRFVRHVGRLDADVWARLRQSAAQVGITPSALLLAAFAEVLAAWSANPRFTINLTLFHRPPLHPQLNDILGDFTAGLLHAVDGEGQTFGDRARRVHDRLWRDLEHRATSSIQVLRDLTRRQGGGAPRAAMPVVFSSLVGVPRMEWGTLGSYVYGVTQTPQVALDHQVMEVKGGLEYCWDAVADLFPNGVVADMAAAYGRLLRRLAGGEAEWREAQPISPPEGQLARRAVINATDVELPDGLLHEPFLRQAADRPDAVAVIGTDRTLTYRQLERLSAGVAARLARLDAGPERLVGVVMRRGWEQVVSVLGTLRSGAAYLPIDPDLPAERVSFLLQNGDVEVVLTQHAVEAALSWPPGVTSISVDTDELPAPDQPLSAPPARAGCLAYVIYTSGSTGLPKGVMTEHGAALNTVLDINARFQVGPGDTVLAVSSLGFDLSVWDIFGVLGAGGTVVVPQASPNPEPQVWFELLERHRVTIWNSVPALLQLLMEYVRGRAGQLPPHLRLVMLSGDWIPLTAHDQLRRIAPAATLISLGGATEAAIWSIVHEVGPPEPNWASVPYGRPLANQRWHVLDARLRPRPDWVTGGLFIAGRGLARGYWRDPEQTAARFVTDPHTGERMYRTGDLGRYRPSGDLEILGREDFQVKILGNRVELGEVEAAVLAHPGVVACCVVALGEPRGPKRLVAHVVREPDTELTSEELRRFLADKLIGDVVPALYNVLPALPLTANGKVDRTALIALGEPTKQRTDATPPATPTEELLLKIVAEVLGAGWLGPTDDFFASGGDSLRAIAVINRAAETGWEIPVELFFRYPTIRGLAAQLAAQLDAVRVDGSGTAAAQDRVEDGPTILDLREDTA